MRWIFWVTRQIAQLACWLSVGRCAIEHRLPWRRGATIAAFGLWVIGTVIWHALKGTLPSAFTMGTVGVAALLANVASF
jgi:hypothetical protein